MKTFLRTVVACVVPVATLMSVVGVASAQQQCGPPASNVVAASAVCGISTRISWTNPPGLVFPRVWRSADTNFANATLVFNPGLFGTTVFFDTPPQTGRNYFYWVGGENAGSCITGQVTTVPLTGPLPAGVFTVNSYPAPITVATCTGVQVSWQPSWDATAMQVVRVGGTSGASIETPAVVNAPASTFLDTTARPGNFYFYGVFPRGACGTGTFTPSGAGVTAGPVVEAATIGDVKNVGQTAFLTLYGAGNAGTIAIPEPGSITWKRGGVALVNNAKYSGVDTTLLRINSVRLEDEGLYQVTIGGLCGPDVTLGVHLSVRQPCRADFDQSGAPTVDDIFLFLSAWFAGCP